MTRQPSTTSQPPAPGASCTQPRCLSRDEWDAMWAEIDPHTVGKRMGLQDYAELVNLFQAQWDATNPGFSYSNGRYVAHVEEALSLGVPVPAPYLRTISRDEMRFDAPAFPHLMAALSNLTPADPEAETPAPGATCTPTLDASDRECSELSRRLETLRAAGRTATDEYTRTLYALRDATRARLEIPAYFGRRIRITTPHVDNRPMGQRTRPDPEAAAREADPAPLTEILDAPPLDCEQPVITTQAAQAQVVAAAFGTRPPRPLRPARQDNIFSPIPQLSLFSGGS